MTYLYTDKNAGYSYIANARSALSAILPKKEGKSFGENPEVTKLLKGIFKKRPQLPRRLEIYDPDVILKYMTALPTNKELMLEELTLKLTTLLCLLSGQRGQTIAALDLGSCSIKDNAATFYINQMLKTTRPGFHQEPLRYEKFLPEPKLCVLDCLKEYMDRTQSIRENLEGNPQTLILSYKYPHNPVKACTIARYITQFLGRAGVDITLFTAHSVRSAATTKANSIGVSIKEIQRAAGWSNESTFQRFYKLPINRNLGSSLLQKNS